MLTKFHDPPIPLTHGVLRVHVGDCHDDVIKWMFSMSLALCVEFNGHREVPVTKASDSELWCFLDLHMNKLLSKTIERRWVETSSCSLWCRCHIMGMNVEIQLIFVMLCHFILLERRWKTVVNKSINTIDCCGTTLTYIWKLISGEPQDVVYYHEQNLTKVWIRIDALITKEDLNKYNCVISTMGSGDLGDLDQNWVR